MCRSTAVQDSVGGRVDVERVHEYRTFSFFFLTGAGSSLLGQTTIFGGGRGLWPQH